MLKDSSVTMRRELPLSSERLCLSVSSFHDDFVAGRLNVGGFLQIAEQSRFRAVELCDLTVPFIDAVIHDVVEVCDQRQLRVACFDIRNDFTVADAAHLAAQIDHVARGIAVASRLGAPVARIWLGCSSSGDAAIRRVCLALREIVPIAETSGVRLAIENHGGLSDDHDTLLRVVDSVESPHLGTCPDFGRLDPRRPLAALRMILPYAFHCHAKSHRFDAAGFECEIDYHGIGAILQDAPYRGSVSIEYEGNGIDRIDGVMKTVALVERFLLGERDRPAVVGSVSTAIRHEARRVFKSPPYVQRCRSENIWPAAREVLLPIARRFAAHRETVGVVVIGGLADNDNRRFIDAGSDLDLAIFLSIPEAAGYLCPKTFASQHPELLPSWLPEFEFRTDVNGRSMEGNCHQLIVEIEENDQVAWPISKQEAFRHTGELLYDPYDRIAALIQAKCTPGAESEHAITVASQLPWYGWINPARQADRGFPETGHLLINHALEILLELLFLANGRLPPHLKWRFEAGVDLPWTPERFRQRFMAVVEERHLEPRIDLMRALGEEVLSRMHDEALLPSDPFRYASIYIDRDRQLRPLPRGAFRDY